MTAAARAWWAGHGSLLWLTARMAVAAVGTYAVAIAVGLRQPTWAALTALIVTQGSVGGSVKAAVDRLVGSLLGAVVAVVVELILRPEGEAWTALALLIALVPSGIVAAARPEYRVAPITAVIVMLVPEGAAVLPYATSRVAEVAVGCVAGFIATIALGPSRATTQLRVAAAAMARLLAEQLETEAGARPEDAAMIGAGARSRKALSEVERLVGEVSRERAARLGGADPEPVARTLRRLRHDCVVLARTHGRNWPEALRGRLDAAWPPVVDAVARWLRALADAFEAGRAPDPPDAAAAAIVGFAQAVGEARVAAGMAEDAEVERVIALAFLLDQLRQDMTDMAERAAEICRKV